MFDHELEQLKNSLISLVSDSYNLNNLDADSFEACLNNIYQSHHQEELQAIADSLDLPFLSA